MAFSIIERKKLKNTVEMVLHAPGNYRGGILEMAMIVDCNLPAEVAKESTKEIISILKSHSEVFRNVRFHFIRWKSDTVIEKELSSMAMILTGSAFQNYAPVEEEKSLDELVRQLKLFYARSKLIILLTDKEPIVKDELSVRNDMQPFLRRKLIYVFKDEEGYKIHKNLV